MLRAISSPDHVLLECTKIQEIQASLSPYHRLLRGDGHDSSFKTNSRCDHYVKSALQRIDVDALESFPKDVSSSPCLAAVKDGLTARLRQLKCPSAKIRAPRLAGEPPDNSLPAATNLATFSSLNHPSNNGPAAGPGSVSTATTSTTQSKGFHLFNFVFMPWSAVLVSLVLLVAVLLIFILVRQFFFKRKADLWCRPRGHGGGGDRRSTICSVTAASTATVAEKYDHESLKDTLLKHHYHHHHHHHHNSNDHHRFGGDDRKAANNNSSSKNASKNDVHVFANDDLFKFLQEKQLREMASDDDQLGGGQNKSADFSKAARVEDSREKMAPVAEHDPKVAAVPPVVKRWSEPAVSPAIMMRLLVSSSPKLKPKNYALNKSNNTNSNNNERGQMSSFGKMTAAYLQQENQSREESVDIEELRNLSDMVYFNNQSVPAAKFEEPNNQDGQDNNGDDDEGGDRRSEHSITDLERMRNVINWLKTNAAGDQENGYEFEEITEPPAPGVSEPVVYNWNSYGILNTAANNLNHHHHHRTRPLLLNRAAKQPSSSMSLFPRVKKQKSAFFE